MEDGVKKLLIILGMIIILFAIGDAITRNIPLSIIMALIGTFILK